jgi:tape measure domain-containing protein
MNKLAAAIASVVSVYAAMNAVKGIAAIGDEYAKITGLLRNATESQEQFNAALAMSKQVAESTRASLTGTVETFSALNRVTQGTGRSQLELFGILETINKSIALTSPNAVSAAAALTQFGQALGGDFKAGAQELNSILEQAPGLAEAVARGLGVPTSALKKMGEEGELSSEKVLDALKEVADDVETRFQKIPKTVSGTLQLIKNDLLVTFGESDVASPLVSSLEELRDTLRDPAVREGLISLASALITITGWAAKAASTFAALGKNIGFFFASVTGQVSEVDALERKIKNLDSALNGGFISSLNEKFAFRNAEETKALRDSYQARIDAINEGITGVKKAQEQSNSPDIKFDAPNLEFDLPDIEAGLKAGYEAQEELARQHAKNLESIETDFWERVNREDREQSQIDSAKRTTESMIFELQSRAQAAQFYRDLNLAKDKGVYEQERLILQAGTQDKLADIEQRAAEDIARRAEALEGTINYETMTADHIKSLRDEARNQDLIAEMTYEQQKIAIKEDAARRRVEIDELEKKSRMASFGALGNALMSLGEGQSRKVFETGKALALAQAAVSLPSAVIQSFKNGGGYPWGLVPAAAMLATGLKNIQQIKSAKFGGGTASATVGGGAASGGLPTTANQSSGETFKQKQVIEVRGINKDSLITGEQLVDIMKTNDNVIVALAGAQQDAQRRGVI